MVIRTNNKKKNDLFLDTNYMESIEGIPDHPDPLLREAWLNPLDPEFREAMETMSTLETIIYNGEPLTTIAHRYYGYVSAWAFILSYNQYLHPDEIVTGTPLAIPDLEELKSLLTAIKSRNGQVITV